MTILAETYIHLKIDPTEQFKIESEEYLYGLARSVSFELFGRETEISIRFEDGSWKAWVAVAGALYIGIGNYGDFRSGVEYLVSDAKKFSEIIIGQFKQKEKLEPKVIYRTERRLGIPGKINRLFLRIDNLKQYGKHENDRRSYPWGTNIDYERRRESHFNNELKGIKREIIQIVDALSHEQDQNIFLESLNLNLSGINLVPPKITFGTIPEIKSDYYFPKLQDYYFPLSHKPLVPSESIIYPRNDAIVNTETESEILKRIIKSKNFIIGFG